MRACFQHAAAEHVDRHRHGAEFVLALAAGDGHLGIAAGEAVHDRGDRGQRTRQAAAEQERQQHGAGQDGHGAENQVALRACRRSLVFGGVLDDFQHRDRLAGVILDLPDIERGGTAAERRVAVQRCAAEHALQLFRRGDHGIAEGRGQLLEVPCRRTYARRDRCRSAAWRGRRIPCRTAAPFSAIGDALAVTHDRRHGENAERIAAHFDADDRLAGLVRLHHGGAPRRDVVAERLWDRARAGRSLPAAVLEGSMSEMPCAFSACIGRRRAAPPGNRDRPWRWRRRPGAARRSRS